MDNQDNSEQKVDQTGFFAALAQLPQPLLVKFMKYGLSAVVFLMIIIALICTTGDIRYFWGLMFTLYFAYMAFSLVWDWTDHRIVCKSMICVKATKKRGERLYLILREEDATTNEVEAIHKFHIPSSKQDVSLITSGTIMTVYFNPKNLGELIAWEITGNTIE